MRFFTAGTEFKITEQAEWRAKLHRIGCHMAAEEAVVFGLLQQGLA